jgi:hypothetical protein
MKLRRLNLMRPTKRTKSPSSAEPRQDACALKAERQRRWRQHARDGVTVVPVEIDAKGIEWLRRDVGVLREADADDPREIGGAIARMIANSAR